MGKTVYFRAFEPEDAEAIYRWTNDDELKRLSVGLNRRICREEALDWVKARMRHNPYQIWWAICSCDNDKMIGYTSIVDIHYINSVAFGSGILIGDPDYRDGIAWLETCLFKLEFVFERLNLNRYEGSAITEHPLSVPLAAALFYKTEGVKRQAVFKNGRFYDEALFAILRDEYFEHKKNGEYELMSVMKRLRYYKRKQ